MHKSWKPSECDEGGLHRFVGDFVSEDLFIGLIKVVVAIVHRMGPSLLTPPYKVQFCAARHIGWKNI